MAVATVTSQAASQELADHLANHSTHEQLHDHAQLRGSWNLWEPASPFNKGRRPSVSKKQQSLTSAFADFIGADSAMGITRKVPTSLIDEKQHQS